jgi:intergrase/recombinase
MQDKSVMGQKILLLLVVECEIKKNVNASFCYQKKDWNKKTQNATFLYTCQWEVLDSLRLIVID